MKNLITHSLMSVRFFISKLHSQGSSSQLINTQSITKPGTDPSYPARLDTLTLNSVSSDVSVFTKTVRPALALECSQSKGTFMMFVKKLTRANEGATRAAIDLEVQRRELASAFPEFCDTSSDSPGSIDTARRALIRSNTHGDLNQFSRFMNSNGLKVLDNLSTTNPLKDPVLFVEPFEGDNAMNIVTDHLLCGVPQEFLSPVVPAFNHSVEIFSDDCIGC